MQRRHYDRQNGRCTRNDSIAASIDAALADGARLIAIAGGDGTIQGVLTHLATLPAARMPVLMILGGGRTNLTPRDFGARGGPVSVLQRALDPEVRLQWLRRRVLTLTQPAQPGVSGFFVAGALVDRLIRDCHRYRAGGDGPLRDGAPSTGWFLLRTAAQAVTGEYRYAPPKLTVDASALGTLSGPTALLLCTTLDHPGQLLNPYAATGTGPLRVTAVRSNAEDFWMRVPRIARGRYATDMTPVAGYLSGRCDRIEVSGLRTVALDGQELDVDPAYPIIITAGLEFEFLQP
jgi:diacylglycerol kinase (ATP)